MNGQTYISIKKHTTKKGSQWMIKKLIISSNVGDTKALSYYVPK